MREILFRAKAINRDNGYYRTSYKNGDWVYGLLTRLYDERFEAVPAEMKNTNGVSGIEVLMLTKSQIDNLIDFFELEFIGMVRKDDCIDNMDYVCDMCDIYKGLKSLQREMDGKEVQGND